MNQLQTIVYTHMNGTIGAQEATPLTHVCLEQQTAV